MKTTNRLLGAGLASLGGLIIIYAVLGPLVLDVIHFRTSASGLNQIRGGDLAALVVVAPVCLAVAWLAWRGHPAAPVLALAPAMFAMYTYSQLILANEYLHQPGNVERFFPLLLAMFILAGAVVLGCWGLVRSEGLPASTPRLQRGSGIFLVVIAAFVVLGIHLPNFVDALRDQPTGATYLAMPTTFWVVKFYDLGIVVPAGLTVGIGLLRRRLWARKPAYAILGGYVLLGWSVAGMAWTMLLSGDPDASLPQVIGMTGLAGAGAVFATFLYRPLFRAADVPPGSRWRGGAARARAPRTSVTRTPADGAAVRSVRGRGHEHAHPAGGATTDAVPPSSTSVSPTDAERPHTSAGGGLMRGVLHWFVVVVVIAHGLIHLLGAAKGFGWADVSQLEEPISPAMGAAWLAAGALVVLAGVLLAGGAGRWWVVGAVAVVASQAVILTSWNDAKAGSVANVILLAAAVHGYLAQGPASYRAEYRHRVDTALSASLPDTMVTDADLAHLPEPVAAYVRNSGAVGKPRVRNFRARIHG